MSYALHDQETWRDRAGDATFPAWFRVAALAYGSHRANGHAEFRPGEVGTALGKVDMITGEVLPMDRSNAKRAIDEAVRRGLLSSGSGSRCLVVPVVTVKGGPGSSSSPCGFHTGVAIRRRRAPERPVWMVDPLAVVNH